MLFNTVQIEWACKECEKQEVGPLYVFNILVGVEFIHSLQYLGINDLLNLASIVEPKTKGKFREIPVTNRKTLQVIGIDWIYIDRAIINLLTAINRYHSNPYLLNPEDTYKEFERIHPFIDGNGRVGAIIYNWMKRSLFNPLPSPEFKED